jgi:hypothetical protein
MKNFHNVKVIHHVQKIKLDYLMRKHIRVQNKNSKRIMKNPKLEALCFVLMVFEVMAFMIAKKVNAFHGIHIFVF